MGTSPRRISAALTATGTEILTCLIPPREGRICPRAVNKPSSPYPSKHNHDGPISQHATYTATITTPARPARNHADQAKHAARPPENPPLSSWHCVRTAWLGQPRHMRWYGRF